MTVCDSKMFSITHIMVYSAQNILYPLCGVFGYVRLNAAFKALNMTLYVMLSNVMVINVILRITSWLLEDRKSGLNVVTSE